jgi:hypothetical protein
MSQECTPNNDPDYVSPRELARLMEEALKRIEAEPDVAPDSVLAEVGAMQRIAILLDHLDVTTQRRVVRWVSEKFSPYKQACVEKRQPIPGRESE